jgi:hypothetical protein
MEHIKTQFLNLPSDQRPVQHTLLKLFILVGYISGASICLYHCTIPIDHIAPREISTMISHLKQKTYSSK